MDINFSKKLNESLYFYKISREIPIKNIIINLNFQPVDIFVFI